MPYSIPVVGELPCVAVRRAKSAANCRNEYRVATKPSVHVLDRPNTNPCCAEKGDDVRRRRFDSRRLLRDFDEMIDIVFDPAGEAGERGNHSFASQSLIKETQTRWRD